MNTVPDTRLRLRSRRANTLVLVTAILVLLVILASAFLVRSRAGRAQAVAEQRATGREQRVETLAADVAQMVADALFVRRIDASSLPEQVVFNQQTGLQGQPRLGEFVARSDFPTLPPLPLAVRYDVDYVDTLFNPSRAEDLAPEDGFQPGDGFIDGYNFAPFATNPFTNWPDRYGDAFGEGNPVGNPGFGDSRWLASTEPVRALIRRQVQAPQLPSPPAVWRAPGVPSTGWSNLVIEPIDPAGGGRAAVLSPEGLGFSHWPHLSWIATPHNGFRLCWDISDVEANWDHLSPAVAGSPSLVERAVAGEMNLGVPYEQWLPFVAPRELRIVDLDSRGYLVPDPSDWITRRNNWFNVGFTGDGTPPIPPHQRIISGPGPQGWRDRFEALPNFLQLSAFGTPADEFRAFTGNEPGGLPLGYQVGSPTPRSLIARTLADADGDGWTDSFWFVAPSSSDRSTRQLVAVRIVDNSALLNVNVATRFERTTTAGQTPADVALATRRESYQPPTPADTDSARWRDPPVGFLNAPENDPEQRITGTIPYAPATADPAVAPFAVYPGVDVGFEPLRWEGRARQPAATDNGARAYQPAVTRLMGLLTEAAPGAESVPIPLFDPAPDFGLAGYPAGGGGSNFFLLTRAADRLTYFKAMASGGELIDPITAARIATLSPFGSDDEFELRAASGLNSPQVVSRLESALTGLADQSASQAVQGSNVVAAQFLRATRSREETSRFLPSRDSRTQDWRARLEWGGPDSGSAARSGAELLMDHRRKLTTVSGARNEMLPPRLWSIIDHTSSGTAQNVTRVYPAFVKRGVDFDGDGEPDDLTGNGGPAGPEDDLVPYHPNVMFRNDDENPFIQPGPNNLQSVPVRDTNQDGRIDVSDFENARQRFLVDNRKVDLRRPNDQTASGQLATPQQVAEADRRFAVDFQRVFRRAALYEDSRRSGGGAAGSYPATHLSYFGRPEDTLLERKFSVGATKMLAASMAANMLSWRDGAKRVTPTLFLDQPLHPAEGIRVPDDAVAEMGFDGDLGGRATFIGVEKQPFLMEVFLAFVYPKTAIPPGQYLDTATPPECAPLTVTSDNRFEHPSEGGHFVAYDPADVSTWPAVVFVAQIANPWNAPVNLGDFELWVNPEAGQPQVFRFGAPALQAPLGVVSSGNIYGPDMQLGPCTPEEPRSAIVFAVPDAFPSGEPFPRMQWLDYLDIAAPLDVNQDGVIDGAEQARLEQWVGNPSDPTAAGKRFFPDARALFEPAWGGADVNGDGFPDNDDEAARLGRRGTLLFDATRVNGVVPPNGFECNGGIRRWTPRDAPAPPPNAGTGSPVPLQVPGPSFVELRRVIRASPGPGALPPVAVVVDRFDNELQVETPGGDDDAPARFSEAVRRLATRDAERGGYLPPRPLLPVCRDGNWEVSGIMLGADGDSFVAWARGARQWLFDTNNDPNPTVPPGTDPEGRGVISLDERTPRFAFSRNTGSMLPTRRLELRAGPVRSRSARGDIISDSILVSPPDRVFAPTGGAAPEQPRWPTSELFFNVWGEQVRGKPVFLPTRIPENDRGFRTYRYPRWRLPAGVQLSALTSDGPTPAPLDIAKLSFGEKGVTSERFVDGTDPANFVAPLRLFQKDSDFDQVAEILDVPMWGPLVWGDVGTPTNLGRTFATLPEILAQGASDRRIGQRRLFFPKFVPQTVTAAAAQRDFRMRAPEFGPDQAYYNRLRLEPARHVLDPDASLERMQAGTAVLPPRLPPTLPQAHQDGIGFNSRLPGAVALLDAFTVDDRGAQPFDSFTTTSAPNGTIEFSERASAEDRRLRLARNFEGRLTPGLVNVNTAPLEVLRALPHMTRLVYDDDFPIARADRSSPQDLRAFGTGMLGLRRKTRDWLDPASAAAFQQGPFDVLIEPAPQPDQVPPGLLPRGSIAFEGGIPAPRVRVAESIDLWRSRLNVNPTGTGAAVAGDPLAAGSPLFPDMPAYFNRGRDLPTGLELREWGAGMRSERGFDSLGELALLSKGAEFLPPPSPDADGSGIVDSLEIAFNRLADVNRNGVPDRVPAAAGLVPVDNPGPVGGSWNRALSWSRAFAGLDPFRTSWTDPLAGAGMLAPLDYNAPLAVAGPAGPLPYRTEGIPADLAPGLVQRFPLSGRTAIDKHLLEVARDDRRTAGVVETDIAGTSVLEASMFRYDQTAGDAIERNSLLRGISNIATVRSDVFTVYLRVRTIRQDPLTGIWSGIDPENILDDSRFVMTVDRSSVDRPGEVPRILGFSKVPN